MDIPRISDLNPGPNTRSASAVEIFRQLTQLGSIEARVAAITRGQAILLTQLGQLTTSNALNLKAGDVIQIRADGNEQKPVLKVSVGAEKPVMLETAKHPSLAREIPAAKPVSAILVEQQADNTKIKVGKQIFTIPRQAGLKPGQLVSLSKTTNSNTIEIKPVDHRQVLKSAISRLLPQQSAHRDNSGITQLVKLVQSISRSLPLADQKAMLSTPVKPTAATQLPGKLPNGIISTPSSTPPSLNTQLAQTTVPINNLVQTLLASIPSISRLDKATLEHWVSRLLTSEPTNQPAPRINTQQLLQLIPKTEASVVQLLQKITQQNPNQHPVTNQANAAEIKAPLEEPLQLLARDIIKLVEQSSSQQLLQQTSLRYQQELQQPLVLNLAIPINDEQKTRELRLKIRQKHRASETQQQCWDIHFDFEFGLLGLISTHLVLEENTLSASFWSEQPDTQVKIDNGLDDFKQQLNRAGFDLGQFYSFVGKPPVEAEEPMMPASEALLDIKV